MPEKKGMNTECSVLPRASQSMEEHSAGQSGKVWRIWIWEERSVPMTRFSSLPGRVTSRGVPSYRLR